MAVYHTKHEDHMMLESSFQRPMSTSGSVTVDEVIRALSELGREASSSEIKNRVNANRGGGLPSQYSYWKSYFNTIDQVIQQHCPQCKKCRGGAVYFEQVSEGRYKLTGSAEIDYPPTRQVQEPQANEIIAEEDDEVIFAEGKEAYKLHRIRERNAEVIKLAKMRKLATDRLLRCEVCGFSFAEAYGELGQGFVEAHHIVPISQITSETQTKVEDIALVCANCHRMLHRYRPWPSLEELKSIFDVSKSSVV